jgi:hypothetical protein
MQKREKVNTQEDKQIIYDPYITSLLSMKIILPITENR